MVCLGEYGTNSAAHVATHMSRSFPNLAVRLMVGIGGAAPKAGYDLRLGDVVVGQRVMQYDQGKVLAGGQFVPNDVQQTVYRNLSSAISRMKAIHESRSTYIPEIINVMLEANPAMSRYGYPTGLPDRLFAPGYDHNNRQASCDECSSDMLMRRTSRSSQKPEIFYGAIASGNSVIRDSATRDRLSHGLDTICFEMESAGFIGHFPCLVVRGICDYADSHKSKEWQRYAAATAAAYAKELLTSAIAPRKILEASGPPVAAASKDIMDLLAFREMNLRKSNITKALSTTCEWFLEHDLYLSWSDPQHLDRHGGFLWISGKAGSGKSTLMKFLLGHEERRGTPGDLVISFFFNARGQPLERSVEGMYRSLAFQLLSACPDLRSALADTKLVPIGLEKRLHLEDLKEILERAIGLLGNRSLVCYVDALDECAEDDIRDMVYHFESLNQRSKSMFRVCFSSRPYPYVRLERGNQLDLNRQEGHHSDIRKYVQERLRSDHPKTHEIHREILHKAAGIFMWVILVVRILSDDFSGERMFAVEERLNTIPPGLSDLFKQICKRDEKNYGEFKLCLQWLLFSRSSLTSEELYYAICAGIPRAVLSGDVVAPITSQAAERFII